MYSKFAYFPGCPALSSCREADIATKTVAEKLELKLVELEGATCCGSRELVSFDELTGLIIDARILAKAESLGLDILTISSTCLMTLTEANLMLKDERLLARVNEELAKENLSYHGTTIIKHLLSIMVEDVGLEKIRNMRVNGPKKMKIAPFYCCHFLRPSRIWETENMRMANRNNQLENLISALGSEPVFIEEGKSSCCGFHVLMVNEKLALGAGSQYLLNVARAHKDDLPDYIVTANPFCHIAYDMYQTKMEKIAGTKFRIPILHLSQLVGLCLGLDPDKLSLERRIIR